jgi:hypothetical protein
MNAFRFAVFRIDAVIADMRISQRDDLPGVGRVGQDFLITAERGVEHHFADAFSTGANGLAPEYRSVGQSKKGGRKLGHSRLLGKNKWRKKPAHALFFR